MTSSGKILVVLGIRPDVIRASLILNRLRAELGERCVFVWSGQHYSDNLKDVFFRQLGVAQPDVDLGAARPVDAETIAAVIAGLDQVIEQTRPAAGVFLGDTNTVLGSIAFANRNIPIVHIEGCMRSYDWRMPEEKYRTVIDHLSDVVYAYLPEYRDQGIAEGLDPSRILVTGNPIVDVLEEYFLSGRLRMTREVKTQFLQNLGLGSGSFLLMTAHRRENVDHEPSLQRILDLVAAAEMPVIFPASYRTQKSLTRFRLEQPANLHIIDPIGYVELLELMAESRGVLTDSGTIVEEAAVIRVPSVQMRRSTERPQVYDTGGCIKFDPGQPEVSASAVIHDLINRDPEAILHGLGDGHASERISQDLLDRLESDGFAGHAPDPARQPVSRNYGAGLNDEGLVRARS